MILIAKNMDDGVMKVAAPKVVLKRKITVGDVQEMNNVNVYATVDIVSHQEQKVKVKIVWTIVYVKATSVQ